VTEQFLIDTNILIYFFDGKLTDKQRKTVIEIFEQFLIFQ
jgi:predicted nucleic acid-binding protein